jgi:hypothetical protein
MVSGKSLEFIDESFSFLTSPSTRSLRPNITSRPSSAAVSISRLLSGLRFGP